MGNKHEDKSPSRPANVVEPGQHGLQPQDRCSDKDEGLWQRVWVRSNRGARQRSYDHCMIPPPKNDARRTKTEVRVCRSGWHHDLCIRLLAQGHTLTRRIANRIYHGLQVSARLVA